jgi:amidohydrolase
LVTYNDPELLKKIIASLEKSTSKGNVIERNWVTGSEDFSYYGSKAPSVFLNLGGMYLPCPAGCYATPIF